MLRRRMLALLVLIALAPACSRMRFVIDAVPADERLTETTVLEDPTARARSKIALVDVTGLLADVRRSGVVGRRESAVARFAEALRRAEEDRDVLALIVRINSPGGTVTATDVMYRELLHFRETTGRPVVILMGDVAASGGYYLACAGDEIIAHPTTITGSIGVVMQLVNFSEGMRRIGIRAEAIRSGPNKTMGSPFEPMPPEQRALLQGIVNDFYGGFVGIVTERRPDLATGDLDQITDGRVVTGRQAVELGLVDRTGDLRDAFAVAKHRAGLASARLVKYHRPLEHVGSAYARAPGGDAEVNLVQLNLDGAGRGETGFYYLWDPSVW